MPAPAELRPGDRAAATEIVTALAAIEDPAIRRGALLDRLARLDPEPAAGFLHGLLLLAVERQRTAVGLLPVVADIKAVSATLGHLRVAAIVAAARDTGRAGVVRLVLEQAPRRDGSGPEEQPDRGATSQLPLGWRTQLGRAGSRDVMDRLLYDQDPRVTDNLLRNSRCTEGEALRIAAHRPTSAAVLAVLFRHPKWIQRYRVRRALTLNPYTAPGQVVSLLPSLVSQDLELIARDQTLHRDVARAAAALLAVRRGEEPEVLTELPELPPEPPADEALVEEEPGGVIETPPELRAALEEAVAKVDDEDTGAGGPRGP